MPLSPFTVWTDPDRTRYFLLPDSLSLACGPFAIRAPLGKKQSVDPSSLLPYELSEQQAKVWVASEITGLLEAIPQGPIDAGPKILAAAHMVRVLPGLIRDSTKNLLRARRTGQELDRLLAAAGIETHSAFSDLPDRIAALSKDAQVTAKRDAVAKELERISRQIEIPVVRQFVERIFGELGCTKQG